MKKMIPWRLKIILPMESLFVTKEKLFLGFPEFDVTPGKVNS